MKRKNKQETLEANRNFSGMKTFTTLMRETLENTRANGDEALFVEIAQLYPNDTFVSRNRLLLSTRQTTPSVAINLANDHYEINIYIDIVTSNFKIHRDIYMQYGMLFISLLWQGLKHCLRSEQSLVQTY